ncbi:FAD-dependent oxidoreductase [Actinokineospora bangkokensis]|uniref:Isorenieratene synthase n=1 Tax=Actinokineospora bangkokensis TaxID=1193682 RepID=A0A1Q9LNQ7_9PSEU|nr:FAD-dependent oxidoreductase [Actinokineospora bangkokensis]OLR93686.1 isorenieratene synthase [Actinokineospora bangkokensis]
MLPLWSPRPGAGSRPPGRDRRARALPGPVGAPHARHLGEVPRVAVVGGGIAGVTAAVALAERGVSVTLVEREPALGGRLTGWATGPEADAPTMTRGFHAFFRQYYNLRALLRRIDPDLSFLRPVADYPLVHSNGTRESFAGLPKTPPWNVASFVLRSQAFTLRDVARINPVAAVDLFDVSVPATYTALDRTDADAFLRDIAFPQAARHLAFEVFSRSFFAHPGELSAAELAAMFHIYFLGSSEGLLFDVPDDPYPKTIWEPLSALLEGMGARVCTGVEVESIKQGSTRAHRVEPLAEEFDAVVLAADIPGLRSVVERSPELASEQWRAGVSALRTAPPFLVSRLWLDRPVAPERPEFLGTSGFAHLDNISVLDRFEQESARWRERTGGSVVELHAYALDEDADRQQAIDALMAEARTVYPELGGARVLRAEHVVRADCPLFSPGSFTSRPTVSTVDPTVVVAGDLVRVDLPVALMERAATTGFLAANGLLAHWGLHGHDLWTVPNEGRSRFLRVGARRKRPVPTG